MLYNLLYPLAGDIPFFNLFRYLTFRSGGAIITALVISFVIGPRLIRWLRTNQHGGQPIRSDGPESHLLTKKGTPTMGGLMMLFAVTVSTLLWADITNHYVWMTLFVTLGYGAIGFADDYLKVSKKNHKGLSGKKKLVAQFTIAAIAAVWVSAVTPDALNHHLALPFLKNVLIDMGLLYFPFVMVVLVGASNAVNLTDGLDGLAIVPIMIAAACFALIAYLVGAQHTKAIERQLCDELVERRLEVLEIAIMVEMLRVDIGHHCNGGGYADEGAIALIGLKDYPVAAQNPRSRSCHPCR
jgi:phospho-N-acetylmuramoyl-pentapeptide-transferase